MKMLFLVDGDNNVGTGLNGIQLLSEEDTVLIFHSRGMQLGRLKARTAQCRADVQFIESVKDGKNSVDFQIVAELGVRAGRGDIEFAYIISQDQGYVAPVESLKQRYPLLFREVRLSKSIEDCLNLIFVLRASSVDELASAFSHEFGEAQGELIFNHLAMLFSKQKQDAALPGQERPVAEAAALPMAPEVSAEPEATETEKLPDHAAAVLPENHGTAVENKLVKANIPDETKSGEEIKTDPAVRTPSAAPEHREVIYPFKCAPQNITEDKPQSLPEVKPQEIIEIKPQTVVLDAPIIPGAAEFSASFRAESLIHKEEKPAPEPVKAPETPVKPTTAPVAKAPQTRINDGKTRTAAPRRKKQTPTENPPQKPVSEVSALPESPVKTEKHEVQTKKPVGRPRINTEKVEKSEKSTDVVKKPTAAQPAKSTPAVQKPDTIKNLPEQKPVTPFDANEKPNAAEPKQTVPAMPRVHTMKLFAEQFDKIKAGTKKIEVRCNDTKRQKIHAGDTIQLIKQSDDGETMYVRVTGMYVAASFAELYTKFPPEAFGCAGQTAAEMLTATYKIFDKRKEKHYGTVGIGVRPLTNEEAAEIKLPVSNH